MGTVVVPSAGTSMVTVCSHEALRTTNRTVMRVVICCTGRPPARLRTISHPPATSACTWTSERMNGR
ncbi:MAG: hypothetical protein ACRDFT_10250 [bacterium]